MRSTFRSVFCLMTFLVPAHILFAQAPELKWAKHMGGVALDVGLAIATDHNGNVYSTGSFRDTSDFNPSPVDSCDLISAGNNDFYISKLDAQGNFVWAKSFGDISADDGRGIAIDAQGNVYTTGGFQGTIDFDPSPAGTYNLTAFGGLDAFISKLDSSGNFVWALQLGGTDSDNAYSIALDSYGNIYTLGAFKGTADLNPAPADTFNLTSTGTTDCFISKLDANGNFLWAKRLGGTGFVYGRSITVDTSDNVYFAGDFQGTSDFDPSTVTTYMLTSTGGYDSFVSKLDTNGGFLWAKQLTGTGFDEALSVALDASGNVNTTGYFSGTVDFDPSPTNTFNLTAVGSSNIYISRLTSNGDFRWAKQFGGTTTSQNRATSIAIDASGYIYTTGGFGGTLDFNPSQPDTFNLTSAGSYDIFISKLDSSGSFVWATAYGNTNLDIAFSVSVDAFKNVYTTGCFMNTVDFDPDSTGTLYLTSAGERDIFVHKLKQCFNTSSAITQTACNSYIAPDGTVYVTSGIKTATIPNVAGCDSTITIDLTINNSTSSSIAPTACFTYISPSGNEIWTNSNMYIDTISNSKGCDSIITILLTIDTVDASIALVNQVLAANDSGAIYQWVDCDNGMAALSGDTNQAFSMSRYGNFAVIVSKNGCSDTSVCFEIPDLTFAANPNVDIFNVYPNPASELLRISSPEILKNAAIRLRDATGRLVLSQSGLNGSHFTINIKALTNGLYFVELVTDSSIVRIKLIKE